MNNASLKSFGVVIAFLLPGFIAVLGVSIYSPLVQSWLTGGNAQQATIGGMMFATIFALGCGLFCSTIRWLAIDWFHHRTGIGKPNWDFRKLQSNILAYQLLEENHYRFYQFYGNSLCALVFSYANWRFLETHNTVLIADIGFLSVSAVLFVGSRDTLRKYYDRVSDLLVSSD